MAEIVNLRRAKRARARAAVAQQAAENRAHHGRSKAERAAAQQEQDRAFARLDGAVLTPQAPPEARKP